MIMFKRRSTFNLSHSNKLTLNMGKLYPILQLHCLPGDSYRINTDSLIRFLPLIAPLMHDVDVCFHYFFVPYRLLWDNGKYDCWETFITQVTYPDHDRPELPYIELERTVESQLSDYLGIPPAEWNKLESEGTLKVSALPYRAYRAIYNSWYLPDITSAYIPPVEVSLSGGKDIITQISLLTRLWPKDYFTSALPTSQMLDSVIVPVDGLSQTVSGTFEGTPINMTAHLGDDSKLQTYGNGKATVFSNYNQDETYPSDPDSPYGRFVLDPDAAGNVALVKPTGTPTFNDNVWSSPTGEDYGFTSGNYKFANSDTTIGLDRTYPHGVVKGDMNITGTLPDGSVNFKTDPETVGYFGIRNLRIYSMLQRWRERALQFGTSYKDHLKSFFGIKSRDSRLQLPEYIGGFKSPCLFSEVLQTSSTNTTTPQGNMAGHGFSAKIGKPIKYFCPEHGIIMGLLSIMPRASYSQGISKDFFKFSPSEYYSPLAQYLGPQAIYNYEIYATAPSEQREKIFGYQDRFSEYKTMLSSVHGAFRSSLDYWHLGRKFESMPTFNSTFIQCDPDTNIFANTEKNVDHIAAHIQHNIIAKRPMAKYVSGRLY